MAIQVGDEALRQWWIKAFEATGCNSLEEMEAAGHISFMPSECKPGFTKQDLIEADTPEKLTALKNRFGIISLA